jgi:dihydrofolate reductase
MTSLTQAIASVQDLDEAFVIGGAQIYQEALPFAQQVIATEVLESVDGDAFFAPLDKAQWIETSRKPQPAENGLRFDIVHYRRKDCGQMEKA